MAGDEARLVRFQSQSNSKLYTPVSLPKYCECLYLYSEMLTFMQLSGVWNFYASYLFPFIFLIGITEREEGRKIKKGKREEKKISSLRLNPFLKVLVLISWQDDILLFLKIICSPSVTNLLIMFWWLTFGHISQKL